ncbi:MAG: Ser/Gly rich, Cys interspersed [Bacteroidetes bacterium]|nr:Ser/Gly rich, Cys interspersed [Bacteroidota bacterium]
MDWLLKLITDMPGPQFLLIYGSVIALTLAGCWWWYRQGDSTASLPAPQIPSTPDPYEIAYLRSGENEVLRVVLFRLLQQGALQVIPKKSGWLVR